MWVQARLGVWGNKRKGRVGTVRASSLKLVFRSSGCALPERPEVP